jgi:hypothetical protein
MSPILDHGADSRRRTMRPDEGNEMNPNDIDLAAAKAERIAFASTKDDGRDRWTELAVYYLHQPPVRGRQWLSEALGCSIVQGERTRMRRLYLSSLDRALKLFEDSDIGVIVTEEARDWAEHNRSPWKDALERGAARFGTGPARILTENKDPPTAIGQAWLDHNAPETDADALAWLYGETDSSKATYPAMLARDMGMSANAITTALREGKPVRVPFLKLVPFLNRDAFRAARKREKGDV